MNAPRSNFALWLIQRILPLLVIGGLLGLGVAPLQRHSPQALRVFEIFGSIIFGSVCLIYVYWASHRQNSGGYDWSALERLGILSSALGALLLSAKLGFPELPGPFLAYCATAFGLAFVVRPMLDHFGWKHKRN